MKFSDAKLRAHEWLADRFSFIQYPHVRRVVTRNRAPAEPQLSASARLLIGLLGVGSLGLGLVGVGAGLFLVGFILWSVIS